MIRTKIPAKAITVNRVLDERYGGYTLLLLPPDCPLFHETHPVIYFLIDEGRVVYIGTTTQPEKRIKDHVRRGRGFDQISYYRTGFAGQHVENYQKESRMIRAFRPKLNQRDKEDKT